MKKFIFAADLHYGFERRNGHKIPLHDIRALGAMLAFAKDFKPDVFIWGGDALDCGVVSHHNNGKPGATEGMKLIEDATLGRKIFIEPVEKLMGPKGEMIYLTGNHERFLDDLAEKLPALEGMLDIKSLLKLDKWTVLPQGGAFNLGKLTFIHGDQLSGGEHVAKSAVISFERSIRFGHHHGYQVYTKSAALDYKNGKTGILVPCLCGKNPKYTASSPNRWAQGFLSGYILPDGSYSDAVTIIMNGRCVVGGKIYTG